MAGSKKGEPRPKKSSKKRAQPKGDHDALIIDAALKWAARKGWRSLSMADIAEETGLGEAEIHAIYPCKAMILNGLVRRIDEQVLAGGEAEGDGIRDRLFDLLMRRFDALNPSKAAIVSIARGTLCDPFAALITGPRMLSSMRWMLEAAGVRATGIMGIARCNVLCLIYANAFRVWVNDETADMSSTMAALDRGLRQAERFECSCRGR
jgi:AcrR family transcriptional regulator